MKKIFLSLFIYFLFQNFISAQNFNLQLRSEVSYSYTCASLWGYAVGGREYALVGTDQGVSIVDVTAPDNPVNLFNVDHAGAHGLWREVKTYGHYCYATNETGNGVLVIDLANLPSNYTQSNFIYDPPVGQTQTTGHTLWIDEKGRLFVFGGNYSQGYACFDLTVDPLNPPFLGKFSTRYIHDGFVRGDTLWAGEINNGLCEIIKVSDPASPVVMASWSTPGNFTHNVWPTSDDKYCFTTDEINNSYLTSYDVSDLSNVTEKDRVQSNPGSQVIIHNVHLYNDQFATVAYYKDGVVIFDVSHPDNMIEVGSYDTDPGESGGDYGGTWGVYPYLPSGNIIASDYTDAGAPGGKLSVLTPTWVAASWLEGNVIDSVTSAPLNNVTIEILTTNVSVATDLSGNYKTGYGVPGSYTIRFSKLGYTTKEIQNVSLSSNIVTTLNIKLAPLVSYPVSGQVTDSATGTPIQGAKIFIRSSEGDIFNATTDANGNYTVNCYAKTYDIFCGKWSYKENGIYGYVLNPGPATINFKIQKGYYDDFILDLGWTITNNAATGKFVRAEPIGTLNGNNYVNPEYDIAGDWGDYCFMTGNGGGSGFTDDVDDGTTTIKSPSMDLSNYNDAVVKFYGWFDNYGGQATPKDSIVVYLSDGVSKKVAFFITKDNYPMSQWNYHEFHVNDFMSPTATMQVTFSTTDLPNSGNVLEAAIDYFKVIDALGTGNIDVENENSISVYPNPFSSSTQFKYHLANENTDARIVVKNILGNEVEMKRILNANGTITIGENLPEGIYFVSLMLGSETVEINKLVKVK